MHVVSALVISVAAACSSTQPRLNPPRPDSTYSAQIANGVTHQFRWYGAGPWAVHTLTLNTGRCAVGFRSIKAQNRVVGRETTSSMFKRAALVAAYPVLAAINADFFSFEPPCVPEGPQLTGGAVLTS